VSWLDLVAYSYLKEELINIEDSSQVEYLKTNCPKLIKFVKNFDSVLASDVVLVE